MADVFAFAEHRNGAFLGAAREAVGVAAGLAPGLGGRARALALGGPGFAGRAGTLGHWGAALVEVGEHEALGEYNPDAYAPVVAERVRAVGCGAVVFAATTLGRDLAPRVAALLDVPLATDVTGLAVEEGELRIVRPVYSGKAFARIRLDATPAVVSIRPNVFPPGEVETVAEVERFEPAVDPSAWKVRTVGREEVGRGTLDVAEATIIVSGGRGMGGPESWHVLEDLRDAIGDGVALGASRAVVDAGWRPHGEQVGQTGKTVAPKLYVAIGISGAIQHLAGMRTSGTIVAVNKDPEAPIFKVADYGIVGDLFDVVPRLADAVRELKRAG